MILFKLPLENRFFTDDEIAENYLICVRFFEETRAQKTLELLETNKNSEAKEAAIIFPWNEIRARCCDDEDVKKQMLNFIGCFKEDLKLIMLYKYSAKLKLPNLRFSNFYVVNKFLSAGGGVKNTFEEICGSSESNKRGLLEDARQIFTDYITTKDIKGKIAFYLACIENPLFFRVLSVYTLMRAYDYDSQDMLPTFLAKWNENPTLSKKFLLLYIKPIFFSASLNQDAFEQMVLSTDDLLRYGHSLLSKDLFSYICDKKGAFFLTKLDLRWSKTIYNKHIFGHFEKIYRERNATYNSSLYLYIAAKLSYAMGEIGDTEFGKIEQNFLSGRNDYLSIDTLSYVMRKKYRFETLIKKFSDILNDESKLAELKRNWEELSLDVGEYFAKKFFNEKFLKSALSEDFSDENNDVYKQLQGKYLKICKNTTEQLYYSEILHLICKKYSKAFSEKYKTDTYKEWIESFFLSFITMEELNSAYDKTSVKTRGTFIKNAMAARRKQLKRQIKDVFSAKNMNDFFINNLNFKEYGKWYVKTDAKSTYKLGRKLTKEEEKNFPYMFAEICKAYIFNDSPKLKYSDQEKVIEFLKNNKKLEEAVEGYLPADDINGKFTVFSKAYYIYQKFYVNKKWPIQDTIMLTSVFYQGYKRLDDNKASLIGNSKGLEKYNDGIERAVNMRDELFEALNPEYMNIFASKPK